MPKGALAPAPPSSARHSTYFAASAPAVLALATSLFLPLLLLSLLLAQPSAARAKEAACAGSTTAEDGRTGEKPSDILTTNVKTPAPPLYETPQGEDAVGTYTLNIRSG